MLRTLKSLALSALMTLPLMRPAHAVEGGIGAYLLGSRESFAGIVPGAGHYVGFDYVFLSGQTNGLSIGGLPIRAQTDLSINLAKISYTRAFEGQIWGATPALNINIPLLNADLSFTGVTPPLVGAQVEDNTSGVADVTFTPMLGWHKGKLHYSAALSIYTPTGSYDTATLDPATRQLDALSNGKNVWSFQPVLAVTHFDPATMWEFSGAASLLFSTRNSATDYQTAPALNIELAALKHTANGWAFGLSGYAYQQLDDDSGAGAENLKSFIGASSLRARVFGAGPVVTYSGKLGNRDVSFKAKYITEFGAKRRFESDVLWVNATLPF